MPTLNIGTFNIAAGKHPDTAAINRLICQANLNIIGLQEIDEATQRNPISMTSEITASQYHSLFTKAIDLEKGAYGIALLSDKTITNQHHGCYHTYGSEQRVWQQIVYPLSTVAEISIYNTHLSFENPALRQDQIKELLTVLDDDPHQYKIILGDFNMDQSTNEWASLMTHFNLVNGYNNKWLNTFNGRDGAMKSFAIDNILTTRNLQIVSTKMYPQILSDHQLLTAKINWK